MHSREKYGIDADERIILFVGRPVLWKGVDHLVLAMEDVLKKIKEARLVIAGPRLHRINKLLRNVSSDVRDRVLVPGLLTGKSLISAYSTADIFVLPSKVELIGTNTKLILFSDPGFGPLYKDISLNNWFEHIGLIKKIEPGKRESLNKMLTVILKKIAHRLPDKMKAPFHLRRKRKSLSLMRGPVYGAPSNTD